MSATITAIAAQKGGTGKTALAASLGPLWALAGRRTLLVDLDQQANLTFAFGVNPESQSATIVDVLAPRNAVPIGEAIVNDVHGIAGLDLVPCDERAEALDVQLRSETMGVYRLADVLGEIGGDYDRVLLDCGPNVGELTVAALLAAHELVCPVNCGDTNALRGLHRVVRTVEKLVARGAGIRLKALVKINVQGGEHACDLNLEALEALAGRLGLPVAETALRRRAAWRTAVTQDVPLILLVENDEGARDAQNDVRRLAHELWAEVAFPYPSEIRAIRRLPDRRTRKAAA